jgi:rubrerythrin
MVKEITETNLRSAYGGESQAHMRYNTFAWRAKDKFPNVSRMFTAIAVAEEIHANNHFRNIKSKGAAAVTSGALFGSSNTSEDLQAGIDGESFEINEMYPAYRAVAQLQGEKGADLSFKYSEEAEKTHLTFYQRAKQSVDKGKDLPLGKMQVCAVCGYTMEGDAPDKCPVCGALRDKFRAF